MEVIFKTIVGSQLYGLHSENSDVDMKGIFMPNIENAFPSKEQILGLKQFTPHKRQESVEGEGADKVESVLYSGKYFIELFMKGNPTLAEIPFVDPKFVVESTDLGWKIIDFIKKNMITKHLFSGYMGYFSSQIKCFQMGSGKHREKRLKNREQQIDEGSYDQKMMTHAYRIGIQGVDLFETGKMYPTLCGEELKIARALKFEGSKAISREDAIQLLTDIEEKLLKAKENSSLDYEPDFDTVHQFVMDLMQGYYHV